MTDEDTPSDAESDDTLTIAGSLGDRDRLAAGSTRVGPYRLLQKVGEGGMGEVWEAAQEEPIRRRVALKLIKLGMDSKQVIARFESERQALALMNHPNIARVFDAGTTEKGRPYFAMEYVKGVPITEYCDLQRLRTTARLELFVKVCEGIQHAHQKAIIHRDIKPANILVTVQDDIAVPKIIDFGVAKAIDQRLTERTLFTELGQFIGTPEYMSPEQAEMTSADVDTRTDVYSLGVLLYELLAGALPFDPKELRKAGFDEMRRRIREDSPPKPSTRVSRLGEESTLAADRRRTEPIALVRRLRGELDSIILKSLEKDRTRRYGSTSELAADITRHLSDEPVLATPASGLYRARKFVRRHRLAVVASASVIVALVAGVGVATRQAVRATRAEQRANRGEEAAQQVSDFLVDLFEVSDPSQARGNTVTARELLDRGVEEINDRLRDQPLIQARLMMTMGAVYDRLGLYEQAVPMVEQALRTRASTLGEGHEDVSASVLDLASLWLELREYADAEELLTRDLAIKEQTIDPEDVRNAPVLGLLAVTYVNWGRYEEAEQAGQRALAIDEKSLGPDHRQTLRQVNQLAYTYKIQGKHAEALPLFQRYAESLERVYGEDDPALGVAWNNLGRAHLDLGRYDDHTERLLERSLAAKEEILGAEHPSLAPTLTNLGLLHRKRGSYEEGERIFQRSLRIQEKIGPRAQHFEQTLLEYARLLREVGRFKEAEPLYQSAIEIDLKHALETGGDPLSSSTLQEYAGLLREDGRIQDAAELIERARRAAVANEYPE